MPVISPLPFWEKKPAKTGSLKFFPRGRMAVTPVRTGPLPTTSLPSPEISVVKPTSTPGTSVIASAGPGVPSNGTPRSRARSTGCAVAGNPSPRKHASIVPACHNAFMIAPLRRMLSHHRLLMQAQDRVGGRYHRAFLPGRQPRGMFARQHDTPIERAEIVVMLLPPRFRPGAGAAQGPWHAMPGDRDAAFIFALVVAGMNLFAHLQQILDALLRRLGGQENARRSRRLRRDQ